MRQLAGNYKRIVIKIGSSLLYSDETKLDYELIAGIIGQLGELVKEGKEVIVVSSGAIALGMRILKLDEKPKELSFCQAIAAIGQPELMNVYHRFFQEKQLNCAQVLLTWEDFNDRKRYLCAKNTLLRLLKLKTVPIVNENDTVSTAEIKFGDNDRLSALVSTLVTADLLIILSDIDGLLEKDKKTVVRLVEKITPQIKSLAGSSNKKTSVGGMVTKLDAANIAVGSGIPCVIANGRKKDVILSAVKNPFDSGTLFLPQENYLAAKKRWIAFSAKAKGKITVDEGARRALINKKSLLSVGVTAVEGAFNAGDIVTIRNGSNCDFAKGKVKLGSKDLDKVKGRRFDKEVIHCDDIVIL